MICSSPECSRKKLSYIQMIVLKAFPFSGGSLRVSTLTQQMARKYFFSSKYSLSELSGEPLR
jgi:hypothetical protein